MNRHKQVSSLRGLCSFDFEAYTTDKYINDMNNLKYKAWKNWPLKLTLTLTI